MAGSRTSEVCVLRTIRPTIPVNPLDNFAMFGFSAWPVQSPRGTAEFSMLLNIAGIDR